MQEVKLLDHVGAVVTWGKSRRQESLPPEKKEALAAELRWVRIKFKGLRQIIEPTRDELYRLVVAIMSAVMFIGVQVSSLQTDGLFAATS